MHSGSDHKLYARVACSMCLGGIRKGIFENCPYCDADRMTYIEASFNVLKENLNENLTLEQKKDLIIYLKDKK
tara:strand:- start:1003 stop:1221 length:219 start_codon:yes stop_codon:yes gene_type:complete